VQRLVLVGKYRQHEVAFSWVPVNCWLLWLVVVVQLLDVTGLMVIDICDGRTLGQLSGNVDVVLHETVFLKLRRSLNVAWDLISVAAALDLRL
jgi:hypothetical protein